MALAIAAAAAMTGQAQAQTAAPPPTTTAAAAASQVGEIVVTGSRITQTGFTTPSPVTVVGAQAVQAFASTNAAEVLADVPSFRPTRTATTFNAAGSGNFGAQTLDLRGLGETRTLVLVDGRRFVPSSAQGTVDLNLIPTMLIDRIEVVSGGASAAYGSDAVAGVANIILDHKLNGLKGSVQYGKAEAGDNRTWAMSVAGGGDWLKGRAHTVAAFEFSDNNGAGNCYTRAWCSVEWTNLNNPLYGDGPGRNGLPSRITIQHSHGATLTPGGIINTPGPLYGTAFRADATPYKYTYGLLPGTFFMSGGDGHGVNPFVSAPMLKAAIQRAIFFSHTDLDMGGSVKGSLDVSLGRVVGENTGGQPRDTDLVLKRDNPYIPASILAVMNANNISQVTFGRQGDDYGLSRNRGVSTTARIVAALKGDFNDRWKWDIYYQYGQNKYDQTTANNRITANYLAAFDAVRGPDGSIVCRSTLTSPGNGCHPLNLIGEGNISPEAKAYVSGTSFVNTKITQHVAAANVQGRLFALPGGDFSVAAGGEYRRDSILGVSDPISQNFGWYLSNAPNTAGKVNVVEGYAEAEAPILKDVTLAKSFGLNGAARVTHYSTSGTVVTWKIGATWEPVEQLRLRVTKSRDIRAANVSELFGATTQALTRVFDRQTQLNWLASTFTGSNSSLRPEKADTVTIGAVIQPTWAPIRRFRLSVDYYNIRVADAVTQIGAQQILDRCSQGAQDLCDLVKFGPAPQHQPLEIRNPWLNLSELHTSGIDIEGAFSQPTPLGAFGLRVLATFVADLATTDSLGSVDRANQTGLTTGAIPGIPEWTVNSTLTYDKGPFSASLESRYIARGKYDATLVGPEDAGYSVNLPNSQSTNRVAARVYFNLGVRYRLHTSGSRKLELFGAVDNLLNEDPPVAVQNAVGTNPILFDTIGRTYTVGFRFVY